MSLAPDAGLGLLATAALGLAAFALRLVSRSGLVAGLVVGAVISLGFGARGFALLALFFVLASAATRVRYAAKAAAGTAQADRGARSARNAAANGVCGVLLAGWALAGGPAWLPIAFAGAFATALADTLGTEIGQAYGRRTFLPTTLRRVPRGTEGAISLEGTAAGAAGATALGAAGLAIGFLTSGGIALAVGAAGTAGSFIESIAHALGLHRRLGGDALNALNTVVGAALAVLFAGALG